MTTQHEADATLGEKPSPREAAIEIGAALDAFHEVALQKVRGEWDYELETLESERGFSRSDDATDEKRGELIAQAEAEERRLEARFARLQQCVDILSEYGSEQEKLHDRL